MAEVLKVETRQPHGKRQNRRMRAQGMIPVNLYGHGEANQYLTVTADQVKLMLRHNARVVDLDGAVKEKAFIRELQWDTYGTDVLHLDLMRISADERVHVRVAVELRGTAAGAKDGGIVEHVLHEVEIDCLAVEIPDKVILKINDLKVDESLSAGKIELPAGAKLLTDPEEIVANCFVPKAEEEAGAAAGEGAEPELIGRKATEEGEEAAAEE